MGSDQQLTAIQLAIDPVGTARLLATVRDAVLSGSPAPATPREVVSESWQRCLSAGVDPDRQHPAISFDMKSVCEIRAGHPLAQVLPLLRSTLVGVADEALHVMVITDATGHVLWMDGQSDVRRLAERIQFVEGVRWTEDSVGTNAIGTAIAVDRPVQIYAWEHFASDQHVWTCAAAPIHDPETGAMLGVVDLSGPAQAIHPATAALVDAAARLAEAHLRIRMTTRDEQVRQRNMVHLERLGSVPGALLTTSGRVLATSAADWVQGRLDVPADGGECLLPNGETAIAEPVPDGFLLRPKDVSTSPRRSRRKLVLSFLGTGQPTAQADGRARPLTLRHAELVAALALHPNGLTGEQLALHVYGETGNPVTVRAEMHRLRAVLGEFVDTKPYRLRADVEADFLHVRRLLAAGRLEEAVRRYQGELLPASDAPAVREERQELTAVVRRAVIDRGDVPELLHWTDLDEGREDLEALTRLLARLAPTDPRRDAAAVRHERLRLQAARDAEDIRRRRARPALPPAGRPPRRS